MYYIYPSYIHTYVLSTLHYSQTHTHIIIRPSHINKLISALEFIFKSKSKKNNKISVDEFVLILKKIYNRREFQSIIEETSQLLLSSSSSSSGNGDIFEGSVFLNVTKFIAVAEMIYLREEQREFNIAISLHYMLEQLRLECLAESGDYIKAGKIQEQIDVLLESESSRRKNVLITKQSKAIDGLKRAHEEQYISFKQGMYNIRIPSNAYLYVTIM